MSSTTRQLPPKMTAITAAATPLLHGGGISRASRCICVISVASAEFPADLKCPFDGFSRTCRRQFSGNYAIFATNAVTTATF
jgi:hypothetical protein